MLQSVTFSEVQIQPIGVSEEMKCRKKYKSMANLGSQRRSKGGLNDSYEYFKWERRSELMAQCKSWSWINLHCKLESFQELNDSREQSFVGAKKQLLLNHFKKKSYIMVGNKRLLLVAQEQSFDNRFCRL